MLDGRRCNDSRRHCSERIEIRHHRPLTSPSVLVQTRHPTPRSTCARTTQRALFSAEPAVFPPTFTEWRGRVVSQSSTFLAVLLAARTSGAAPPFLLARHCSVDRPDARRSPKLVLNSSVCALPLGTVFVHLAVTSKLLARAFRVTSRTLTAQTFAASRDATVTSQGQRLSSQLSVTEIK
jgi:hypothetical protein